MVAVVVVLVVSRAFTARRTKDLGNELELACSFWYAALAVFVVVAVAVFFCFLGNHIALLSPHMTNPFYGQF